MRYWRLFEVDYKYLFTAEPVENTETQEKHLLFLSALGDLGGKQIGL